MTTITASLDSTHCIAGSLALALKKIATMRNDYDIQEDILTELKWQPFLVAQTLACLSKTVLPPYPGLLIITHKS
jgi:hypothetical protein